MDKAWNQFEYVVWLTSNKFVVLKGNDNPSMRRYALCLHSQCVPVFILIRNYANLRNIKILRLMMNLP